MGYRVVPVKNGKGPEFRVMFEWFEQGVRRNRTVKKDEWGRHGFNEDMTLAQAQERRNILNIEERKRGTEKKRQKIVERLDDERDEQSLLLNSDDIATFERDRLSDASEKVRSYWNTARRILATLKLHPSDWEPRAQDFYREFYKRKMSPAYVQKVLPLINAWGAFNARKYKLAFMPIPAPPRHWRDKLYELHHTKERSQGNKESAPLTPQHLDSVKEKLKPEQARWLAFTIWFGLRPVEADLLSKPSGKRTWWVEHAKDKPVLCVYQTKLIGMSPEKRVKRIPANEFEQRELAKQLGQSMKRPLQKTMTRYFGGDITLYGGRKGFVKLMKERGHKFEHVSAWLGHTKLERTYQSYFDRSEVVGV